MGTLTDRARGRLKSDGEKARQALEALHDSLDLDPLLRLLARAEELEAVSTDLGFYTGLPETPYRVQWSWDVESRNVSFRFVSTRFEAVGKWVRWSDSSPASDCILDLARELERLGHFRDSVDLDAMVISGASDVLKYVDRRAHGSEVSGVVFAPNPNWAVTEYGVEAQERAYFVHHTRLDETDWIHHVGEKTWVDRDEFAAVMGAAREIFDIPLIPRDGAGKRDTSESEAAGSDEDTGGKPRVFIASSVEGIAIAEALQQLLDYDAEVRVWHQGAFSSHMRTTIEDLVRISNEHEYGVFVASPDDISLVRGSADEKARDNVIFELGLFVGALGRDRCFIVAPRGSQLVLPTDLAGISPLDFDPDRSDGDLVPALGPTATKIKKVIKARSAH